MDFLLEFEKKKFSSGSFFPISLKKKEAYKAMKAANEERLKSLNKKGMQFFFCRKCVSRSPEII